MRLLSRWTRHALLVVAWCAAIAPLSAGGATLHAQAPAPQPAPPRARPLFTWTDAAVLGGFAATTIAIAPLDRSFADRLQRPRVQENRFLGDVATIVRNVAAPGTVIIGVGMYAIGRLTDNDRVADLGLHGTEALLIGETLGVIGKGIAGRARPYQNPDDPRDFALFRGFRGESAYRSFPSGHTIAAFAAAAAVASETDRWWPGATWAIGPMMYGGAALAGASRMYNNRHWASDVVVGAAIGTFAGLKVVRWHHDHPDNRVDRFFLGGTVTRDAAGSPVMRLSIVPAFGR